MTGTLVLLSGGMDSTALLALAVAQERRLPVALSVNYGQRHVRELEAARAVAEHYGVPHHIADLSALASLLPSALTGVGPVPYGHYAESTMAATVVPNRNAIMLMVAAGVASATGCSQVATAVHAGDHPVYPDCRPEFIEAASEAAQLGTAGMGDVAVVAPFVRMSKAAIVSAGYAVAAPFDCSWSCYEGGELHCGRCGTCVERAEAFDLAGVTDPTEYADPEFWRRATREAAQA